METTSSFSIRRHKTEVHLCKTATSPSHINCSKTWSLTPGITSNYLRTGGCVTWSLVLLWMITQHTSLNTRCRFHHIISKTWSFMITEVYTALIQFAFTSDVRLCRQLERHLRLGELFAPSDSLHLFWDVVVKLPDITFYNAIISMHFFFPKL